MHEGRFIFGQENIGIIGYKIPKCDLKRVWL
jgi:hypothetical protein